MEIYLTGSPARVYLKHNSPVMNGLGSLYGCLFFLRRHGRRLGLKPRSIDRYPHVGLRVVYAPSP